MRILQGEFRHKARKLLATGRMSSTLFDYTTLYHTRRLFAREFLQIIALGKIILATRPSTRQNSSK